MSRKLRITDLFLANAPAGAKKKTGHPERPNRRKVVAKKLCGWEAFDGSVAGLLVGWAGGRGMRGRSLSKSLQRAWKSGRLRRRYFAGPLASFSRGLLLQPLDSGSLLPVSFRSASVRRPHLQPESRFQSPALESFQPPALASSQSLLESPQLHCWLRLILPFFIKTVGRNPFNKIREGGGGSFKQNQIKQKRVTW